MKVAHGRRRWCGLVVGGGAGRLLALAGTGFLGTGITIPLPEAHGGTNLNDGWINGDQSGSLVGLDPEGKFTQAFPLKHIDVSIQVSRPLARAQVTQELGNAYS